jgi:hypothetical protein
VDNLPNTASDAADIAEKLLSLGYDVDLRLNAGFGAMTRAIGEWIHRLSAEQSSEGFFGTRDTGYRCPGKTTFCP